MAERATVPPPPSNPHNPDPDSASRPNTAFSPLPGTTHRDAVHCSFPSGTYVVQVPKNQIYRVPPPHNARIAEQQKNHQPLGSKSRPGCCRCILCSVLLAVIILIVTGVAIGVSVLLAKPKNPVFRVDHLAVRNSTGSLQYDLKLDANNPNSETGILYREGGVASLRFKENEIADGKYPILHQGKNNTATVLMVLKPLSSQLPEEIKESFKGGNTKVHVSFLLNISVPARMKFGFFSEQDSDIGIICNFTVDTLAQGTRVLSQSCQTTRHRH